MDWESPSRTRIFGAAALLIAAAGLSCLPETSEPLLNDSLGALPTEAALKKAGIPLSAATGAAGPVPPSEFFAASRQALRDAPFSPPGLLPPGRQRSWSAAAARRAGTRGGDFVSRDDGRISVLLQEASRLAAESAARASSGEPDVSGKDAESKTWKPAAGAPFPGVLRPGRAGLRRGQRVMVQNLRGPDQDEDGSASRRREEDSLRRRLKQAAAFLAGVKSAPAGRSSRRSRPRFRPLLLSRLLGKRAIRPPRDPISVPDLSRLAGLTPKRGPDGRSWEPAPALAKDVEAWRPPERFLTDCRQPKGHWHRNQGPALYHHGKAWGMTEPGRFGWLARQGGRWWAWTAPLEPTWLSYQGRWWWNSEKVWFLLHEAEAWGYRLFLNGRAEGLIHPATGTSMIYSEDGGRVAVVTPGDGAVLFDAVTGQELGRWSQEQINPRTKPSVPSALTLPP